MGKANQAAEITLSYSLFDLPSAQHKAGLAGLLLLIDSLQQRGTGPLPEVHNLSATSVQLIFSKASMQTVFDDLYDARLVERTDKSKWSGKTPKRVEIKEEQDEKSGKVKKQKSYIYDVVEPKAVFLEHHYPGDEKGWLKLWRDMLWQTLRAQPKARGVYEQRLMKSHPCQEAEAAWKELHRSAEKQGHTQSIAGSLFVGAQATNAERVKFEGSVDQNLLLHFWPLTLQIFVPKPIGRDGKKKNNGQAYVLAIPEVSDLEEFCEIFPRSLAALDPQIRGYRPSASIITLPEEGGMEFLRNLSLIAEQRVESGDVKYSVSAIELFSLEKRRNSVKTHTANKIIPRQGLLSQYEGVRQSCRNPFFKSRLLLNLLRDLDWAEGFLGLFSEYPAEFFIHTEKTPRQLPFFSTDARKKFRIIADEFKLLEEAHAMAEATGPKPQSLEKRIYDMIGAYVRHKTEAKSNFKWSDFRDKKTPDGKMAIPPVYVEAKQKICMDAFLAMRSRREQEFIEYFAGTICSVPQFLPADDYVFVSQALLEENGWEKVKTLSMLALSAHS
jgi:CRISPR-associated protein Cmx8